MEQRNYDVSIMDGRRIMFKVGDKVRCIESAWGTICGETYTVRGIQDICSYEVYDLFVEGNSYIHSPRKFILTNGLSPYQEWEQSCSK